VKTSFLLFPGRHHVLTRFQADYLRRWPGVTIVWAVTSANHENTKRNPVPYHRREAAIERFSVLAGLRSVVVPVFDTAPTGRFAEVTVKNITVATGLELTPENTVVACSTPAVAALYAALGFTIAGVEADSTPEPARPWDVLLRLAAGDESWRELAHPATIDVFDRYQLHRHVRPGRIVDIGCGAGAVLELADRDPALRESDLIGVEIARHLFEECMHKKAQGVFGNANVFFYRRNVLGGAIFPERSIDTTLTFALTHEIWSYGDRWESLRRFAQAIYDHTAPGGVWINSDVCGPDGRDREVRLTLDRTDGDNPATVRRDLDRLPADEVASYVAGLSTRARLDQFAADFRFPFGYEPVDPATVRLTAGAAMDYLTRKDYADNWLPEVQEQFCGLEYADWKSLLTDVGFEVDPASGTSRNDWVIDNRIAPVAALTTVDGEPLDWPVTHVLLIARRPLNT
jgi:SAM-dependent methyltransferase